MDEHAAAPIGPAPGSPVAGRSAARRLARLVVLGGLLVALGAGALALLQEEDAAPAACRHALLHYGLRVAIVAVALAAWFLSQSMIAARGQLRGADAGAIGDGLHGLTAPLLRALQSNPRRADLLLILSSACIDAFGVFLIGAAVLGPSMRPFLALLVLFGMRQVCQALCALPPPPGMIWRYPGFPALLVTYAVGNDFFFSGHTAIAVLGALELARLQPWLGVVGGIVAAAEALVVIVLRAHYTMDVFTAALAAWGAYAFAGWICGGP
jgi:hypothetical protein